MTKVGIPINKGSGGPTLLGYSDGGQRSGLPRGAGWQHARHRGRATQWGADHLPDRAADRVSDFMMTVAYLCLTSGP